jgi:hypothetical protein
VCFRTQKDLDHFRRQVGQEDWLEKFFFGEGATLKHIPVRGRRGVWYNAEDYR